MYVLNLGTDVGAGAMQPPGQCRAAQRQKIFSSGIQGFSLERSEDELAFFLGIYILDLHVLCLAKQQSSSFLPLKTMIVFQWWTLKPVKENFQNGGSMSSLDWFQDNVSPFSTFQ